MLIVIEGNPWPSAPCDSPSPVPLAIFSNSNGILLFPGFFPGLEPDVPKKTESAAKPDEKKKKKEPAARNSPVSSTNFLFHNLILVFDFFGK